MFITVEGGEGSGKSTLIEKITKELSSRGIDYVATREPGGSALGELIREILLSPKTKVEVGKRAELMLFLAARAQHIEEVILPALQAGKVVICDRFNDSTVAYQGAARTMGLEETQEMCDVVCNGLTPDLTLYLDLDPEMGLARMKNGDPFMTTEKADRIESEALAFHQKVRHGFHSIVRQDPDRFCILDASSPQEVVFADAMKEIEKRFALS